MAGHIPIHRIECERKGSNFMCFANREEKLNWLKSCADKLRQLEYDRKIAIVRGDFAHFIF